MSVEEIQVSTLKHALIVDNDQINLEVLGQLLASEGVSCTTVQDPNYLDSVIASAPHIDIVFLDLELPNMDGYMAFRLLQYQLGSHIPIVACTEHVREIRSARELGFQSFLSKPLDRTHFPEQFKSIESGQHVWDY